MRPPLDSDLLRSFLAVAESGSLTAAAARVGRTQSAVSMQIKRLEEITGRVLFLRQPRGVALTEAGQDLVPYARQVGDLLDAAALALQPRPVEGPVRVGFPPEYCDTVLPGVLAAFAARHSGVDVRVICDYSDPQRQALAEGRLDLALVYDRPEPRQGTVLLVEPTVWVTSRTYCQHMRRPLPIAVYFNSSWSEEYMIGSLDRMGVPYRIAFECDTTHGFLSALRSGLAVVALTRSIIPDDCRELTARDGFAVADLSSLVMLQTPRPSAAVYALAAVIEEAFREGQV